MQIHQDINFVKENGLQSGSRFTYNPNVFRDKAIPGGLILGCTGSGKFRLGI
jgi:hypothetical protein